jgi:hypothetical protein
MSKYNIHNFLSVENGFVPETFGRWVTVGPKFLLPVGKSGREAFQVCQCLCDNKTIAILRVNSLKTKRSLSCGCLRDGQSGKCNQTHGEADKSVEYSTWVGIRERCKPSREKRYPGYAGRGIRVCDRWNDPVYGYVNFLADMGRRPPECVSIDRIDNDGNYEHGNCRWATSKEQQRNTRHNVLLTHKGKTQCVSAWAEELGIGVTTLRERLRRNRSIAEVLDTPVRPKRR